MATKKLSRKSPKAGAGPVFISAPQVLERFGHRSFMWLVRLRQRDPTFPDAIKVGRLNFFRISDLENWERRTAARSRAA
jgi:hypothetical protein